MYFCGIFFDQKRFAMSEMEGCCCEVPNVIIVGLKGVGRGQGAGAPSWVVPSFCQCPPPPSTKWKPCPAIVPEEPFLQDTLSLTFGHISHQI